MKQKSRIASKLFAVLVVLTLISCCFLGTTFARYTSRQSGAASVDVANWDITVNDTSMDENTFAFNFGQISPDKTDYATWSSGDKTSKPTNTIAPTGTGSVVIKNAGEVDATVTITIGEIQFLNEEGTAVTFDSTGYEWEEGKLTGSGASAEQVQEVLKLSVTLEDGSLTDDNKDANKYQYTLTAGQSETQSITITVSSLTWTTNYTDGDVSEGAVADAIDTWIGENIASVKITIDCVAVQASEQPTT